VLLVPLEDDTRNIVNDRVLSAMKPTAFLVNLARGGVLDEDALLEAVRAGRLAGAALDVYATEPLPMDSPLRSEDRILLSPHAGGATREAQGRLIGAVVENVRRAVSSEAVENVVNGVDPVIARR